jgi:hypothetical protein
MIDLDTQPQENRFALIEDGVVVNVVIAYGEWPHGGQAVNINDKPEVGPGWLYQSDQFSMPAYMAEAQAPEVAPLGTSPLKFIERFTEEEQLAVVSATLSNPAVKLWYDKLLAAREVVFADPRLAAGLDGLVAAGLITPERRQQILPEAQTSGVTVL